MREKTNFTDNIRSNILLSKALLWIFCYQQYNGFRVFKRQVKKVTTALKIKKIIGLVTKYQLDKVLLKWKLVTIDKKVNNFMMSISPIIKKNLKKSHDKRMRRLKRIQYGNKMIPQKPPGNKMIPRKKPVVFLTHAWSKDSVGRDTHQRVKILNNKLLDSCQIETWFDEDKMRGHIIQAMCDGIDDSNIVIVCITRSYIEKCASRINDNCKIELDYSFERKGVCNIIPVVMDPDCLDTQTWNGPVGAYLNKSLYISLVDENFENVKLLISEIYKLYNRKSTN